MPGLARSVPRKSAGSATAMPASDIGSTMTTSSRPSSSRAPGAISTRLPYCRPLAMRDEHRRSLDARSPSTVSV